MPGGRIDTERAFTALGLAVLTISDSRDAGNDTSGDLLAERIRTAGHHLRARALVRGDKAGIQRQARAWTLDPGVDVIITNGGTGLTAREVAPEALRELFDRELEDSTCSGTSFPMRRWVCPPCNPAPAPGSRATRSSTFCPAPMAPAATGGTN